MTSSLEEKYLNLLREVKDDLPLYCERYLKIKTKRGVVEPLVFNKAQLYIHERIEQQRSETGRVRAIILKGRQQGCSTYVEARYFHKTSLSEGKNTFILTHEDRATNNLFEMTNRYYTNITNLLRPHISKSNAKELIFDKLDSSYKVGTAKTKGTGRSGTIHYFHGSEVAFWANADDHISGIMQCIPDVPGTESILESTSDGVGNLFHTYWQAAESGQSDYIAIFIPWFWQEEYSKPMLDVEYSDEDIEYADTYKLRPDQMAWRHSKIVEFKGDVARFNREYPATPQMAFEAGSDDSFIKANSVSKARQFNIDELIGDRVYGVDPARFGDDRTAIVGRTNRKMFYKKTYTKKSTMEITGAVHTLIKKESPSRVYIDVIGLGAGVYDRLVELGHEDVVVAVNAAEGALDSEHYYNKRAELWGEMREWLEGEPSKDIPDDDELASDLCSLKYKYTSSGQYQLEKKEDAKRRGIRSPDVGDALALTFNSPINSDAGAIDYSKIYG